MTDKAKYIILLILVATLAACANIQAPSGGPPDTTPPVILSIEPANSTLNFDGKRVKLGFSKYMNKNSVIENFYILPTTQVSFDWSGKDLTVRFEEPLRENTTYSINIGSDYSDLKNNKPEDAFNLIFSTGEVIDSGKIAGKILSQQPQGLFVYAYNISRLLPDTLNPLTLIPEYKVQIGSSGNFTINGLPDGTYRLFAVGDKFKDGIISDGQDFFACSYTDATVASGISNDVFFRFGADVDLTPPKLFSGETVSDRKVRLYFSEMLDSTSITNDCFLIIDSLSNDKIDISSAYIDFVDKNIVNIITSEPIPPSRRYMAGFQENCTIKDTSGNAINDFLQSVRFTSTKERDSSLFELKGKSIKDSASFIPLNSTFKFYFSEPLDSISIDGVKLRNISDSVNVKLKINHILPTAIEVIPEKTLKCNSDFLISIEQSAIKNRFGIRKLDSAITLFFKTEDNRGYGSIAGVLVDSSGSNAKKVIVVEPATSGQTYFASPDAKGAWKIEDMKPGLYKAWIFEDRNGNGKYDFGKLFPFEFAEKFYLTEIEINVRSRWALEGVILRIGK